MKNTATYRRTAGAVGLVLAAALMVIAMGADVSFSGEPGEVLAEMDAAGARAWISAIAYTFAQLALIAGALGIAHLLRPRAPRLSNLGGTLAVVGAFGHTVHAGGILLIVSMAQSTADTDALTTALNDYTRSPAGLFSAMGLLGTVLGLVVLTVGLWRAAVGPRWVPAALAAFMILEFVGSAVSMWASAVAGLLYLSAFAALAVNIWRSPVADWEAEAKAVGRKPVSA